MPLAPAQVTDLNMALDEARIERIRWDVPTAQARFWLRVLALPAEGGESDPARVLVLDGVSQLRVLLRRDCSGTVGHGPPVPIPDQEALDEFLGSLSFQDSMHGGKALDDASPTDDWPPSVSLTVVFPTGSADHSLYWFTECGREEPGGTLAYLLEGLVTFRELGIHGANGHPIGLDTVIDESRRWWEARLNDDPRVCAAAQRQLLGPAWGR